jgi:HlyD family secretion protein
MFERPSRKMGGPGLAQLGMATAVLLWLPGCGERHSETVQPTGSARAPAFVASAKGRVDVEGGVIRLAAQREGVIERVLVEEGDVVRAGQVLAVLVDEQARRGAELARAEAAQARAGLGPVQARMESARREVDRLEPLAADDTVPRLELDQARDQLRQHEADRVALDAAVQVAEARLQVALHEIEQRIVRAPLSGKVVRRQARPGDGVSVSTVTPLFLFAPDGPRIVRAEVEERWLAKVAVGQSADIVLEADDNVRLSGRVLRVGQVLGQRLAGDDPNERQDQRVVECVLSLEGSELLIGQRVIVRFRPK